ncbi:hypothetical protein C7451_104194 [Blastomonas natatoria]|uniref:Uncharacterized protein n=1 Tax=Blastomonas natatoria TaxID=34015 RepID=A0A2V3VAC3_9SPHN|nr:hypothetical protein [Blastomonas natatoria]PXW77698.1 hypothetical protein C7451_104194 [Blastomonas natatoria]
MKLPILTTTLVAIAGLGLLAGCSAGPTPKAEAATREPADQVHMDLTVTKAFNAAMTKAGLDEGQRNVVKAMAHQQAVAITCAGFAVNKARFEDEMNVIYYDDKGKMLDIDSDALHLREKQVMMGFGMAFGAQLAIAASDEKAFCEHAEVERNARDAKHLILDPPSKG